MKRILFPVVCSLIVLSNAIAQLPRSLGADLDAYINKGLSDWQLPGLALVIVKDGQIVKLQGYGVKDVQSKTPVDANTHFFIASNSKLFTGTALANLEQQGKLNLNDPITKYYPDYQLYDPINTKIVTILDMLSHRIGTKTFQGDFTFWNTTLSRSDIMQRMRLLKPSTVFRQDYGYCNSCFMTAGEIIPKVIGQSWEQYVQDSILNRLDMRNSFAASNGIELRSKNIATPYTTSYSGELKTVPYDKWDNLGPAASIVSNAQDLSKWLLFQLDSGRHNGQRIMPWSTLARTRSINVMTGSFKSSMYPINFRGYGLGVFAADYNGHQLYWHTGGAAGMVSNVCFVPDLNLGIAILTNNDNQNFFEALRYQLLDYFLKVPPVDRSAQMLPGFQKDMQDQLTEVAAWRNRVKGQAPQLSLEKYTGTYVHALYGNITVSTSGNKQLLIRFQQHPNMTATLSYMDNNEWLLEYSNIEYGIFATKFGIENNAVTTLTIPVNPFVEMDAYTFTKH